METRPFGLQILDAVTVLLLIAATCMVFFYAPREAAMGEVQRLFYFHVAAAWVGMLGFVAAGAAGIVYLRTQHILWDIIESAAVEISLVFFFIAILLGSIWARPIWNAWWTWDPRLTTAAILELIYIAYMMLRQGIEDPDRRARFGAVYTLVGVLSIPITFLSIRLFRTIHPVVIGTASEAARGMFGMTPPMKQTFFFCFFIFTVIFADLFWNRILLGNLSKKIDQLRYRLM